MKRTRLNLSIPTLDLEKPVKTPTAEHPAGKHMSTAADEVHIIKRINESIRAIDKGGYTSESEFIRLVRDAGISGRLNVGFTPEGRIQVRRSRKNKRNDIYTLRILDSRPDRTIRGIKKAAKAALDMVEAVDKNQSKDIPKATSKWGASDVAKIRRRYQILEEAGYDFGSDVTWSMAERLKDVSLTRITANLATWNVANDKYQRRFSEEKEAAILSAATKEEAMKEANLTKELNKVVAETHKNIRTVQERRKVIVAANKLALEQVQGTEAAKLQQYIIKHIGSVEDFLNQ